MRVICITQARMGSSRLPGKVLTPIANKPMLEYHIERVAQSHLIDTHIIATTIEDNDQAIADYCHTKQLQCFRGDEQDVLQRFYEAALSVGAEQEDIIIRLTGDCPLICPELIDQAIRKHQTGDPAQYTHISLAFFPRGFDVEVFSMHSLTLAFQHAHTQAQREHVTLFLYTQPDAQIIPIETGKASWGEFRLCVDEIDDLRLVEQTIQLLGENWLTADHKTICKLLTDNPELAQINKHVAQRIAH
ncbi:cytidylyltransferase domain-containing protein [Shewanella spartinae]|uniref:cytidylyltransferase domain-containing protein n=1 Tax=Shewanella spartinae TaxID=2864205 RepID=UPI001C65BBBB|nr:glycosyltransferase family protein [Shewanella spartinae]QYJ95058.1 glycosyltransferase family protein [Shewanella spartinae]